MGQPDLSALKQLARLVAASLCALWLLPSLVQADPAPQIINPASHYPEGALKQQTRLLYAEMPKDRVMVWNGETNAVFWSQRACGPTSIAPRGSSSLLIACHMDNLIVELPLDANGQLDPVAPTKLRAVNRPNDTISDAKGGTYISSSGEFSKLLPRSGKVYYLSPEGVMRPVARDIWYANGLVISPDGQTLYVSEHLGGRVLAYTIGQNGSLSDPRTSIDISDYADTTNRDVYYIGPDGLTIDDADRLYVCIYGAGEILIFAPDQTLLHRLSLPQQYVTNIDLSADENTLYITAPAENNTAELHGEVFSLPNPVFNLP